MTKAKRRGKRNRRNKKVNKSQLAPKIDNVRTCVTENKNYCSHLPLGEISPLSTPSPKVEEADFEKICEILPRQICGKSNEPENSSTPKNVSENSSTPKNVSELKLSETSPSSFQTYKTPIKRINSVNQNVSPTNRLPKRVRSTPSCERDKLESSGSFFTPLLSNNFPLDRISPIHSTPKSASQKPEKTAEESETDKLNSPAPTKRVGKFRKTDKWPLTLTQWMSWLEAAIRKGFDVFKRIYFKSSTQPENVQCNTCKNEIPILRTKVTELSLELLDVKKQLNIVDELRNEVKELREQLCREKSSNRSCTAPVLIPPPPPPPPPPPVPLNLGQTPTSRPLKVTARKGDKYQNENCRPIITVDDIRNVHLRKISVVPPPIKKAASSTPEDFLKQVKLRPPSLPQTPQILRTSPKSSLARILKTVDTNVRTVRRRRKSPFLRSDDVSRQPSFPRNDSAPVYKM